MNCDVTLKADEFKTIHNALWALQYRDGVDVNSTVETIREALSGAYEQERNDFDRKYAYYSQVKEEIGAKTIWSIYEVEDLYSEHPFTGADTIVYENH